MDIIYNEIEDGIEITSLDCDDEIVVIPNQVDGKDVVSIDFFALNIENAREVILPDTLKNIYSNNFSSLSNLEKIDMKNTKIECLEDEIFSNCSSLKEVILPDNLKLIKRSFLNCKNLLSVKIPDNVTEMEEPFIDSHIENFNIGKNVTKINFGSSFSYDKLEIDKGNHNFLEKNNCIFDKLGRILLVAPKKIKTLTLPEEIEYIAAGVFCGAEIETLDLKNATQVGDKAFEDAKIDNLIANKLIKVANNSFKGLHTKNIELGSIIYLSEYMFSNASIGNIKLNENLTTICEGAFFNADIKSFVCPKKLTVIDTGAFENSKLEKIEFNNGLEEIGPDAFKNALMNSRVFLPTSLRVLGKNAFTYSPNSLYKLNKNLEYNDGIDVRNNESCEKIIVPVSEDLKDAYYEGTNLEKVNVTTTTTLSDLITEGLSFKEMNQIFKEIER